MESTQPIKHWMYFHVRPGTSRDQVDFNTPLVTYMKKKRSQGWEYDRLTGIEKTPGTVITERGDVADEWNIYMSLRRRPVEQTMWVPDNLMDKFLKNPRFKEA